MNFNYLYIDEKSLSYNELLKKFVLSEDNGGNSGSDHHHSRERSNTNAYRHSERIERPRPESFENRDLYYNVSLIFNKLFLLNFRA
jgi:hypothetical protein